MRSSANSRSRLESRSWSMRSRTAGKVCDAVIGTPFHYAAERAAQDGLTDRPGAFAARLFGEFSRDLGGDTGHDRARNIAGDLLRGRQRRAVRPADPEDIGEPLADPVEKANMRRRLTGSAGSIRRAGRTRGRERAASGEALLQDFIGGLWVDGLIVFSLERALGDDRLAFLGRDRTDARRRRPDEGAIDHRRRAVAFKERHQRLALAELGN